MIRTFQTHRIRRQQEQTESLWHFTALSGENAGKSFPVATPSCWETYPGFELYRGEGKYETTFCAGGDLRIECKGVSHTANVYLDGVLIRKHYNAYTPFSVLVKDVPKGEHTLSIVADNRFSPESALHIPNDYMSYGGVTRPVAVEEVNGCYLERIHITPVLENGRWRTHIEATVCNLRETRPVTLRVRIAGEEAALTKTLPEGESELALELSFSDVKTWSPETPVLYTAEAMMHDLLQIKDLGANSVRTAHDPNDERFLDLCDELGILVWEENHARGLSLEQMQNPNFERQAEEVTREMVLNHYNHPSIYIWGILNECASDSEYGKECYRAQFEIIRSLDKTRPTSFASCKFKTDLCFGLPDVVSYNIYPKWYHDTPVREYLNDLYTWMQDETDGRGKPFLVTEIGAGGLYGYRTPYASKWSEEY